jgi:hypothetical protein
MLSLGKQCRFQSNGCTINAVATVHQSAIPLRIFDYFHAKSGTATPLMAAGVDALGFLSDSFR